MLHSFFSVEIVNFGLARQRIDPSVRVVPLQSRLKRPNSRGRFAAWVEADGSGVGFDSSAGLTLPNGAKRAPDVSWIRRERWDALTEEQKNDFAPICPDFVVDLRSKSDRLKPLEQKMEEYIDNGALLGWLIDPLEKKVHVYRPGAPVEVLDEPSEIAGDPLLKGFVLNLDGILD